MRNLIYSKEKISEKPFQTFVISTFKIKDSFKGIKNICHLQEKEYLQKTKLPNFGFQVHQAFKNSLL